MPQSTAVAIYSGTERLAPRAIGALAADVQWPFVGPLLGGVQRLVPRVQLVLTPPTPNLDIPNEDARSIDLEDSNLFALNRFPGYDRWEDASRVTYGFDWSLDRRNLSIDTTIGQSYRLVDRPGIFPQGTGLTDRLSDIVGRTSVRYGRLLEFTHRFRIDKDNFAVRRNEIDLTIGTTQTYAQVGYLKLNRNVDPTIEDLRDVEELRFAGRSFSTAIGRFSERRSSTSPTRTKIHCQLRTGSSRCAIDSASSMRTIASRSDLPGSATIERVGTFRAGNTFGIHLALKGIGR